MILIHDTIDCLPYASTTARRWSAGAGVSTRLDTEPVMDMRVVSLIQGCMSAFRPMAELAHLGPKLSVEDEDSGKLDRHGCRLLDNVPTTILVQSGRAFNAVSVFLTRIMNGFRPLEGLGNGSDSPST